MKKESLFKYGVYHLFVICFFSMESIHCIPQPRRVKFSQVIVNVSNNTFTLEKNASHDSRVLIAVTIKNNAYSLPTFLATLENIKCPNSNNKCNLWIIFDNCTDQSYDIFIYWLTNTRTLFDTIIMLDTKNDLKTKEKHSELDDLYFSSNLKLRALKYAKDRDFSHVFFLNADTVITNSETISILLEKKKPIVAPLLVSSETQHSTFWLRLNYYQDEENNELYDIYYKRKKHGCFKVSGVQECFMIDLSGKNIENFFRATIKALEDIDNNDVQISYKARYFGIIMYVCNRNEFGYVPDKYTDFNDPYENFIYLRMEHLLRGPNKTYNKPLKTTEFLDKALSKRRKTKLGFDQIYVVNLERRKDRRERIESALNDLNLSFNMTKAVDSKVLNEDYLKELNVNVIPNYVDPYHDRSINYGEIACFLSHYNIWKDMVEKKYEKIIILEDDARFEGDFKPILTYLINEMKDKSIKWELLYLGRKIMKANVETWNYSVKFRNGYGIRNPDFSHWTVAYALTIDGAKKLLNQEPLKKIVPIDEYLPIMFDKQPNDYWSSFYSKRDLIAYAIQPSIVMPTHYFGEPGYISDTEQTPVLDKSKFEIPIVSDTNSLMNEHSFNKIDDIKEENIRFEL